MTERRPDEEFGSFLERLDAERLRAIGEEKELEARAFEQVADEQGQKSGRILRVAARAKRASAEEWLSAWESHPGSRDERNGGGGN